MKSILSLCVVLAVAVLADCAVVLPVADLADNVAEEQVDEVDESSNLETFNNLDIGHSRPGDILLFSRNVSKPPRPNQVQSEDVNYVGAGHVRISAVRATGVGGRQNAIVRVVRGGVGFNHVTLRVQSAVGHGYSYRIDVWGR